MPTQLSPLEEALFQAWAKAHRIDNQDDPSNSFDHRGVYKRTNGLIHPPGHINQMAAEHNAQADAQDSAGPAIDPAMAAVEHQKNQMDAQKAQAEQALKIQLADKGHAQKMELEKMKLQHKSMESEKDRAMKTRDAMMNHQMQAAQADKDRQAQMQQSHADRQMQVQQSQADRHGALQQALMQRHHALQDRASDQQNETRNKMLSEHLTRTRPQPKPTLPQGQ